MSQFKHDFNLYLTRRLSNRLLNGLCYLREHPAEDGGLGPYEHFKRYCELTWPTIVNEQNFHPWMEWRMRVFCDPVIGVKRTNVSNDPMNGSNIFRSNIWSGCAAAGKSFDAALFAMAWWSVSPMNSSVVICTTSKQMSKRRSWPVIQRLFHEAKDGDTGKPIVLGHLMDSQTMLQYKRGDSKHAIAAFAVEPGELQASIGKMKGMHTERMLLLIDEADSTPPAIFEVISNMRKGCREFVLLVSANSVSLLDAHGQVSEPKDGWESVSVESEEWVTKPIGKWNLESGICLHFDGEKSPNVKAGRTKWPYIYTYEDYIGAKNRPDYSQSVQYWSFERGFWAPEGAVDRVVTPQKILKYQGRDNFKWTNMALPCAGLDPAFGGNCCVLQFGVIGNSTVANNVLELQTTVEIFPSAVSKEPVDYQIARRVIEECKRYGVTPERFALDSTGTGRGIAAILAAEWSNAIVRVEFGGQASDRQASSDSPDRCRDLYQNRVTELWFNLARLLESGKLRGLPEKTCKQLCGRPYVTMGRRLAVLPKEKMKELQGGSPDHADAAVVLVELARNFGVMPDGGKRRVEVREQVTTKQKAAYDVWTESSSDGDRIPEPDVYFGVANQRHHDPLLAGV